MNNQDEVIDPETQALEQKEHREMLKAINSSIKTGKALEKLRKTPEFKELFDELFLTTGAKYLWDNIRHIEEEQMKARVPQEQLEKGLILLGKLKDQIHGRLIFESFLDTVEHDYENAKESLVELEAEEK